jgi:hypothetical protein
MTKVEPDVAVIVLSVVTQNAQAITAQQENARRAKRSSTRSRAAPARMPRSKQATIRYNRNTIIAIIVCQRSSAMTPATA